MTDGFWRNAGKAQGFFSIDSTERETLLPVVADTIRSLRPETVLDYGCGDGYVHTLIGKDIRKYLYDINPEVLQQALDLRQQFNCTGISKQENISDDSFDVILLSLVLVCIPTLEEQACILKTLHRAMHQNGRLVFVTPHPCFSQYSFRPFHTSFVNSHFPYMEEGIPYTVTMHEGASTTTITDYHYSLTAITNLFADNGFRMERMIEVADKDLQDRNPFNEHLPPFMIIIYKKNEML